MLLKPLPIIRHNKTLSLWNIHYLNLNILPALEITSGKRLAFVRTHVSMCFSDRENRFTKAEAEGKIPDSEPDVVMRVKQSLGHLCIKSCGLDEEVRRYRVVGLSALDDGVYTLIFVNDIRLDLASHTVVLDACVLPLSQHISSTLALEIKRVHDVGVLQINTKVDEVRAWKHLLPAYSERCRTWSHNPAKCEYFLKGVIPISVEINQTPLCSCGKGKNLGTTFETNEDWKPFAPYVTRVAISPLFPVPFVDTISGDLFEQFYKEKSELDSCAMCGGQGKPRLLVCSACKKVNYCSPDCQRVHWKVHKRVCKRG
jgi:hypothetical protein